MNNAMLQEMCKFNDNFAKLQAELVVTKRVTSELCKRIVTIERQCWANVQYSRRECLEVAGIPQQVDDKNLETKVLSIFHKIGCTIDATFIDDCYRLSKNNVRVIGKFTRWKNCKQIFKIKKDLRDLNMDDLDLDLNNVRVIETFTRWKNCKQIFKIKKDLRDLNMDDLDLPRDTKIYINQSLCPYYRILWSKAKRLQNIESIDNFYISSESIKIKVTENSSPDDFKIHFPDIDLSAPTDASQFKVHNMLCSW